MENEEKISGEILDKLCEVLESGEKYWLEKKEHYSLECSISGECGKSMKTFYYNMGQTCLDSANEIRKLGIPGSLEEMAELPLKIREIIGRTPVPDEFKGEIENYILELGFENIEKAGEILRLRSG